VTRSTKEELSLSVLDVSAKKPIETPIGSESKLKDFWLEEKLSGYRYIKLMPRAIPTMLTA